MSDPLSYNDLMMGAMETFFSSPEARESYRRMFANLPFRQFEGPPNGRFHKEIPITDMIEENPCLDVCAHCGKEVDGTRINDHTGAVHVHCYERNHPPKQATSLREVFAQSGSVFHYDLIRDYIMHEDQMDIVNKFNQDELARWYKRAYPENH